MVLYCRNQGMPFLPNVTGGDAILLLLAHGGNNLRNGDGPEHTPADMKHRGVYLDIVTG